MDASQNTLVIDRDVRNWVLLPLTVSVILLMLLRQYASVLMMGSKNAEAPEAKDIRQKAVLARSRAFRSNFGFITEAGFRQRMAYLNDADEGALHEKIEKKDMTEMMMTNPDAMMGGMRQQLATLGPQLALGAFVNFFFRGFILAKLPFALSPRFRGMVQSGIDLPSLDVSYLSSLSLYMLLLFGSRGLMTLFFQDAAINDAAMFAQAQMQTQMGFMNPNADPSKAYASEKQALALAQYSWRMEGSEARAAQVLRQKLGRR